MAFRSKRRSRISLTQALIVRDFIIRDIKISRFCFTGTGCVILFTNYADVSMFTIISTRFPAVNHDLQKRQTGMGVYYL
jgi:acetyltransferase-like isoleucine patch superfamily enzyme